MWESPKVLTENFATLFTELLKKSCFTHLNIVLIHKLDIHIPYGKVSDC